MAPLKNWRQERFCLEYIRTGNGTRSAIAAGYSRKTARQIAHENLTKPHILARIAELQAEISNSKIADIQERKEILTEIARKGNVKQTNPVEAIRELNRMGGDYPPTKHLVGQKVIFEVVYVDRKELPEGGGICLI